MATNRERLCEHLIRLTNAPRAAEFREAELVIDSLDAYLAEKNGRTMRDRLYTALQVAYSEVRTQEVDRHIPSQAALRNHRELLIQAVLDDDWVVDRLAGLMERG